MAHTFGSHASSLAPGNGRSGRLPSPSIRPSCAAVRWGKFQMLLLYISTLLHTLTAAFFQDFGWMELFCYRPCRLVSSPDLYCLRTSCRNELASEGTSVSIAIDSGQLLA